MFVLQAFIGTFGSQTHRLKCFIFSRGHREKHLWHRRDPTHNFTRKWPKPGVEPRPIVIMNKRGKLWKQDNMNKGYSVDISFRFNHDFIFAKRCATQHNHTNK